MAFQTINVGAYPNDTTGDPLQTAFTKVNANFAIVGGSLQGNVAYFSQGAGGNAPTASTVAGVNGASTTLLTDVSQLLNSAIQSTALAGTELIIDQLYYMQIGNSATNAIFLPPNAKIRCQGLGGIVHDGLGVHPISIVNSTGVTLTDFKMTYIPSPTLGSFGVNQAPQSNANSGAAASGQTAWIAALRAYMINTWGNTFQTGVNPTYSGFPNGCAMVRLMGAAEVRFAGKPPTFSVPSTATADQFMPACISADAQFNAGLAVTSGTAQNPTTCSQPQVHFDQGPVFDGCLMGMMGTPALVVMNTPAEFIRYSDLQNTVANDPTGAQIGGLTNYFAPPHRFYMETVGVWPGVYHLKCIDRGQYTGIVTRRSASSGFIPTGKAEPCFGSTFDYVGYAPDGCALIIANGYQNGFVKVRGIVDTTVGYAVNSGSTTATATGIAYPGNNQLINVFCDHDVSDNPTGGVPAGFPVYGTAAIAHQNLFINARTAVPDWPATNYQGTSLSGNVTSCNYPTGNPGFSQGGTNVQIDHQIGFVNCSSLTTFRGSLVNSGFVALNNSRYYVTVTGWRSINVTFTGTNIPNGTTTLPALTTAFTPPSGTYPITFSDGETRQTTFTNGSTAVGNIFPAIANPNGTSVKVLAAVVYLSNSLSNFKSRVTISGSGVYQGVHGRLEDPTNGYTAEIRDSVLMEETWAQTAVATPAAGATYTVPGISFPSTMSVSSPIWYVSSTAIGGPTSINVGDSGSATRFMTGMSPNAGSNISQQQTAPIALVNNPTSILLTAVGGNFTGTGSVTVGLIGRSSTGAS